jgi:hypothetical protein
MDHGGLRDGATPPPPRKQDNIKHLRTLLVLRASAVHKVKSVGLSRGSAAVCAAVVQHDGLPTVSAARDTRQQWWHCFQALIFGVAAPAQLCRFEAEIRVQRRSAGIKCLCPPMV